jgi:hypothetical protein
MKIEKKRSRENTEFHNKIRNAIPDDGDFMSIFITLLGASEIISQRVLESEAGKYLEMPTSLKYAMLQYHQILSLVASIIRNDTPASEIEIGGHFPTGDGAWQSETDFEKRFILFIKLFHKHLKKTGKI